MSKSTNSKLFFTFLFLRESSFLKFQNTSEVSVNNTNFSNKNVLYDSRKVEKSKNGHGMRS